MVQVGLTIVVIIVLLIATFVLYRIRKNERPDLTYIRKITIDELGETVSQELAELVRDDDLNVSSDARFQMISENKRAIAEAIDTCIYGVLKAKNMVLAQIRYIMERELPTEQDCLEVVNFKDVLFLEPNIQWEILMYLTKKNHREGPMGYLNKKYGLSQARQVENEITGEMQERYLFDYVMLGDILEKELTRGLEYTEMLDIISILVYQKRFGFFVLDTLRSLDIDGFNFGTSGSVRYVIDGKYEIPYKTTNSVWV